MTCRDVQSDLALFAGGDLEDRTRVRDLRQHVAGCPVCKARYQSLKSTLKTLGNVGPAEGLASATWVGQASLWPGIRRELARPPVPFSAARALGQLRHWTPFAAMTAACVLMLVTLNQFSAPREQPVSSRGLGTQPPLALQPADTPRSPSESEREPQSRHLPPPRL